MTLLRCSDAAVRSDPYRCPGSSFPVTGRRYAGPVTGTDTTSLAADEGQQPADAGLLERALRGDDEAFRLLVAPHQRSLHVHCYRMLGSYTEAQDAVQDTLLRAWRSLATFQQRAPLHHWLYRISTTTCLKAIEARGRRPVTTGEVSYLQPYPDRLLDDLAGDTIDPAAVVERRESVALAFITALQRLPATGRAALILCDVLSFTAKETADLLETSVPAVTSALQRARGTIARGPAGPAGPPSDPREQLLVRQFVHAWHSRDLAALAALLREDAILAMPPEDSAIHGRDRIVEFFATVPADGRLDLLPLVPTRANGHPAVAAYLAEPDGTRTGYGLMVLITDGDQLAGITGFPGIADFERFGLPATVLPGTDLAGTGQPPYLA